jgi:hypothetical protein
MTDTGIRLPALKDMWAVLNVRSPAAGRSDYASFG